MRQVNGWGFTRITSRGPDCNSYYHQYFMRDQPDLIQRISRQNKSSSDSPHFSSNNNHFNYYYNQIASPSQGGFSHPHHASSMFVRGGDSGAPNTAMMMYPQASQDMNNTIVRHDPMLLAHMGVGGYYNNQGYYPAQQVVPMVNQNYIVAAHHSSRPVGSYQQQQRSPHYLAAAAEHQRFVGGMHIFPSS